MKYEDIELKADEFIAQIDGDIKKKVAKAKKEELLKVYKGDDRVVSFLETVEDRKSKEKEVPMKTGHYELDSCISGGLYRKELILVTGLTGNGKTSFAFDMTRNMEKFNPLWLPYEESAEELADKIIHWKKQGIKFYHPKSCQNENIDWIEERILEAVLKFNTQIVFIDNLHFITMTGEDMSKQFASTGLLVKQLKQIASKLDVCIVLIAHLRKTKNGIDKIPTFEDVSGSSDSVKVANKILCVWREAERDSETHKIKYSGKTIVDVQKVRGVDGKLNSVEFSFKSGVYKELSIESVAEEFNKKIEINFN